MQLQKSKVYWIKIKFSAICCLETLKDFQVCQRQTGEIKFYFAASGDAKGTFSDTAELCGVALAVKKTRSPEKSGLRVFFYLSAVRTVIIRERYGQFFHQDKAADGLSL